MDTKDPDAVPEVDSRMWTARTRARVFGTFPPEKLLPDSQPAYVASWIYVFGVASLAAFILLVVSGLVLTLGGPSWYHSSGVGHFVNSLHFWSVQLFMLVLTVHLFGQVLDGSLARQAAPDLDLWGPGLLLGDRHRLHRLPRAVELRVAVDRVRGQGRTQRGGDRGLVQRRRMPARCCSSTWHRCRWSWLA